LVCFCFSSVVYFLGRRSGARSRRLAV
jgi:hypothetical protein